MFWKKKVPPTVTEATPVVKRAGIEVSATDAVLVDKLQKLRSTVKAMTEEQRVTFEIGLFFKELSRFMSLITMSAAARAEVIDCLHKVYTDSSGVAYDSKTGGRIALDFLEAIEKMCKQIDTSYDEVRDIKNFD